MKKLLLILILIPCLVLLGFITNNNFGSKKYTKEELKTSHEAALKWLFDNKEAVYKDTNPILWAMLGQTAQMTQNYHLGLFVKNYLAKQRTNYSFSPWSTVLGGPALPINVDQLLSYNLPHYSLYLIYGSSCNKDLGELDIIKRQHETNYCLSPSTFTPECMTYQAMGMLYAQNTQCKEPSNTQEKIQSLAKQIKLQSIIDFRVVNVYLQRQLVLLQTGNYDKINQRWIKRILDNQGKDGGWNGFEPLIPVGNDKYIGFTKRSISMKKDNSTLHATAQGIMLTGILLSQQP